MTKSMGVNVDFSKQIQAEIKELELQLGRVFAGIVEEAFVALVFETPQYSGTMAASWNMTMNRNSYRVSTNFPYPENPYQKGDMPAIMESLSNAQGKSMSFKDRFQAKGWTIQINNAVPYAEEVNAGVVRLRSEVGHHPGFVEQFIARIESASVGLASSWNYYANTDFLGKGAG